MFQELQLAELNSVEGALSFGGMGAGVAMVTDVITGSIFKW